VQINFALFWANAHLHGQTAQHEFCQIGFVKKEGLATKVCLNVGRFQCADGWVKRTAGLFGCEQNGFA
jgi:hypothetical protein